MNFRAALVLLLLTLFSLPALAVLPDEILKDPALEGRARELSRDIRCLVCQNQSIDDSNADLARDLRILVRERLVAGDSDTQVMDYLVSRYGDFVLLRPPVKGKTYFLWFGPAIVLIIAVAGLTLWFRRRRTAMADGSDAPERLSPEERDRLATLLDGGDSRP
ncbi:MAG: cytochrome c-type biogenesis protein CcmH [Proteobacteria bacterium]|jgi:cytochrome c-type biogenesis protein CcmH|nr:cytochrome c-type biogenesis protein CcmH [Pseudomonadota bacterium]